MKQQKNYDLLIVGAGPTGAVVAHQAKKHGLKVLVLDRRLHIAGNTYTRRENGIDIHEYGAHIFHTSNQQVWDFVQQFALFNNYVNSPLAYYQGTLYNLPFNMNTFYQLFGTITPSEARDRIDLEVKAYRDLEPQNLEEQALKLVGSTVYNKLIKGYTEKQWGRRPPRSLPLLLSDCRCGLPTITTISMTPTRVYPLMAIRSYFDECSRALKYG